VAGPPPFHRLMAVHILPRQAAVAPVPALDSLRRNYHRQAPAPHIAKSFWIGDDANEKMPLPNRHVRHASRRQRPNNRRTACGWNGSSLEARILAPVRSTAISLRRKRQTDGGPAFT